MPLRRHDVLPGEEVLVELRPHWTYLIGPLATTLVVVGVVVGLDVGIPGAPPSAHWVEGIVAGAPCVWLVARFVRWRRTSLVVTSHRVIEEHGVVTRTGWEIRLDHVGRVDVVQSVPRRLLGTGTVVLTAWDEGVVLVVDDVRKPVVLQRVIGRRLRPPPGVPMRG